MTHQDETAAAARGDTPRRGGRVRGFGVGRIAMRQLRARPALSIAQGLTLAAAVTLLASVVLIQGSTTDNGLRSALSQGAGTQAANLVIERDGIAAVTDFDGFQGQASTRVRSQVGDAVRAGAEIARSPALVLRSIDAAQQGQPLSNVSSLSFYAGLREHVHVVAGRWPTDSRAGADWLLTASARATDTLGTPLDLHVGSEYCFSPPVNRGSATLPWCGRLAATWLPASASDPYWAGHIPETDVLTEHDSFFQIAARFPSALNSAIQQYVPNPSGVSGANAASVVRGVNQLRGYYSVSSNDVFVSGLDTTITAFLARQDAASGPMLVTSFGLLVVALAAMGFAALQFVGGHAAQVALWRARGWPRRRAWMLYATEFSVLALAVLPVGILVSAAISTAVAGSSVQSSGLTWQSLANAAIPSVVATAAFLLVLAGVAAVGSGPELSQRASSRPVSPRRSWRRWAVDLLLLAVAVAILLLVRFAGDDTAGPGQSAGVVLALPVLAVGLLAAASLRLVGVAARVLAVRRTVSSRLARWQLERDPGQFARLCLLVTLAVTVGVFASTYTASERASAIDRADYMVGADMRATFSSAASPPQLSALTSALPGGVRAAQVFRSVGRPGRTGTDSTVLGIQGTDFWDIAYSRSDFATPPLRTLTSTLAAADPDGVAVSVDARALLLTVYSSGFDARLDIEVTDATGRDVVVPMGTLGTAGWSDMHAVLTAAGPLAPPVRIRALRVTPHGRGGVGDVALENLRTDAGTTLETFAAGHGWWDEAFAPDPASAPLKSSLEHTRNGEPSVDIPVDLQAILVQPPAASRGLPVLLAASTMASLGVGLGQPFPLHMDTVDVELVAVGTFDEFPTHYPQREDLIVAPRVSLLARLGMQGATSPWANELWISFPSNSAAAVNSRVSADSTLLSSSLRTDAENAALSDPLRVGIDDELGLGFVVALAVVVVGFGLHFLAAARNRATQYAIMRANGVPQAALRRSLAAEQLVVLITGVVGGTAIGLALAWAVIPIFHLGALPQDVTPSSVFHVDPLTLLAVVLGTGAVALVMGRLVAGVGSRVDVMTTVRSLA